MLAGYFKSLFTPFEIPSEKWAHEDITSQPPYYKSEAPQTSKFHIFIGIPIITPISPLLIHIRQPHRNVPRLRNIPHPRQTRILELWTSLVSAPPLYTKI